MKVTIHQPNFFPRLKILQKLSAADVWVVLDNVQYSSHEWQNRTKLIPINGYQKSFWLTLPVKCPNGKKTIIKDVEISSDRIIGKTKHAFKSAFSRAPYWGQFTKLMDKIYPSYKTANLSKIDVSTTIEFLKTTGKVQQILYASKLPVSGKGSKLVAAICDYVKADVYLCDSGGKRYLDVADFSYTKVVWQRWEEPTETWDGINSWRDISCINYFVREGEKKFVDHLNASEFRKESDFY